MVRSKGEVCDVRSTFFLLHSSNICYFQRSTSDSNNSSTGEKTWGWTFRTLLQPDYTAGQIIGRVFQRDTMTCPGNSLGNEKTTGAEAGIESITLKAYPSSRGVEVSLGTGKSFMSEVVQLRRRR